MAAAHVLARVGYGCEISPAYCDVILRRIAELAGEEPVLAGTTKTMAEVAAERAERATRVKVAVARTFGVLAGTIFGLKFGDVAKLATKNKQLAAIAKLGKPSQQVSEVLTLAQVQKHLR